VSKTEPLPQNLEPTSTLPKRQSAKRRQNICWNFKHWKVERFDTLRACQGERANKGEA